MSSDLSPENEQFINAEIARGLYRDRTEAVDAAVALLRQKEELLARINRGREQLDSGQYTDYDDRSFRDRFDELGRRIEKRTESNPSNQ